MPLPLIPLAIVGAVGLVTGSVVSGDNNNGQVIVNPPSGGTINLKTVLLMGGAAVAAVYVAPRILGR